VPFFLTIENHMNESTDVWIKTKEQKIAALLSDEAKMMPMLKDLADTVRQLQAKNKFRLALLNQLMEEISQSTK
jgi:hypothetical protein